MTSNQLASFRQRLADNRQPIARGQMYAHPRGWNDALDFVERTLKEILGESANDR